jgi:chemotaxis protein methyltransferase CheR
MASPAAPADDLPVDNPPAQARLVALPSPAAVMQVDAAGYERLTREVRALLGFDLAQYKAPQVWRRVNGFANARGYADVPTLLAACRTDPALKTAFRDMITINVSEFFRNADAFETFRTRFLTPMVRSLASLKVWSAGCSLGYEPYSIAMLVREQSAGAGLRIVGTDLDETILAQARTSRYTEAQMLGISAQRRARFFTTVGDAWEVKPELRALVTWRRQDLLRDPFERDVDIIACRNVVIYFTEEAKTALYAKFAASLRPGGILFIGATESISNPRAVGLEPATPGFYRRPEA